MMTDIQHMEPCQHALVAADGTVVQIVVEGHDPVELDKHKAMWDATEVLCCCVYGTAFIAGRWDGAQFTPPTPPPAPVEVEVSE
jgi:hypothetical protein